MNKLTILVLMALLVVACSSESNMKMPFSEKSEESNRAVSTQIIGLEDEIEIMPEESREGKKVEVSSVDKESKIIKEGNMRIEVMDLTLAKSYIDSLVSENNGYYEKEILRNSEYNKNYSLKIRVPSINFGFLVNAKT